MKTRWVYPIPFVLAICSSLPAQTPNGTVPWFSLTIEEKANEAWMGPGSHWLQVKYTNVSAQPQWDSCAWTPGAYDIAVRRDGAPLERRKKAKTESEAQEPNQGNQGSYKIRVPDLGPECSYLDRPIAPGQSIDFSLWPSAAYDMSVPGTYEVTVTRETDPRHPDKSVTVKSNSLTIVVPPPDDSSSPPQP